MNTLTFSLRRRLVKDYNLPIHLHEDPYFPYLMDLYNLYWDTNKKAGMMNEVLAKKGGREEDFFKTAEEVVANMSATITHSQAMKQLTDMDAAEFEKRFPVMFKLPTPNIYHDDFLGKALVSVDLKNANFNVIRLLGLGEELNAHSYEDWMKEVTPFPYFQQAKGLRQVVFGHLQPKRQQRLQKYVMGVLAAPIIKEGGIILSSSSDELIIEGLNADKVQSLISGAALARDIPQNFWRTECFILQKIIPDQSFYLRASVDLEGKAKQDFKMVPSFMMPQVYKAFIKQEVQEEDLVFLHEGKLSRFLTPSFVINKKINIAKPSF